MPPKLWGVLLGCCLSAIAPLAQAAPPLTWRRQTPIPDAVGFAGPLAGVHGDVLIVAGGANFPDAPPWAGGEKVWHDRVFTRQLPDGAWRQRDRLPRPLAYGVSLSTGDGVLCLGGGDAGRHVDEAFRWRWDDGRLRRDPLPPLPAPVAFHCGAMVGETIYLAGGITTPTATRAERHFWALDIKQPEAGWRRLSPWPGPGRILAVAGADDDAFYLFGGAELSPDAEGRPQRRWLRDAYCFRPGEGWRRLADMPRAAVAAPSPTPRLADGRLLVLGGDDGAQVAAPASEHRGFPRDVLAYDIQAERWTSLGDAPCSLVTTPAIPWSGGWLLPGGEVRPGVRSTEVWHLHEAEP